MKRSNREQQTAEVNPSRVRGSPLSALGARRSVLGVRHSALGAYCTAFFWLFSASVGARAADPATRPVTVSARSPISELFSEAGAAYASNDVDAAVEKYSEILARGYFSAALFRNLGNCYLREGDFGRAVLFYRRAWYEAPRDAENRAYMDFAARRAGTRIPVAPTLVGWLQALSLPEWVLVLSLCYWAGFAFVLALPFLTRIRAGPVAAALALAAVGLGVSAAGIVSWHVQRDRQEAVVVGGPEDIRLAPAPASRSTSSLAAGAIVSVLETSEGWARVSADGQNGWVTQRSLEPVLR